MRRIVNPLRHGLGPALVCALAVHASEAMSADSIEFTPVDFETWSERSFAGETPYSRDPAREAGTDHGALRADCSGGTASGRLLEREVDLGRTPILEWRWRVDSVYEGLDERTREGDDYPARIYVIAQRWPAFRSRAINYVWSSRQPVGSVWDNAYSDAFAMVAVQSGDDGLGAWVTERRDVHADFQRLHGLDVDTVDVLALMTDCDDAGQSTMAWYGPIRWLPAPPPTPAR